MVTLLTKIYQRVHYEFSTCLNVIVPGSREVSKAELWGTLDKALTGPEGCLSFGSCSTPGELAMDVEIRLKYTIENGHFEMFDHSEVFLLLVVKSPPTSNVHDSDTHRTVSTPFF